MEQQFKDTLIEWAKRHDHEISLVDYGLPYKSIYLVSKNEQTVVIPYPQGGMHASDAIYHLNRLLSRAPSLKAFRGN